MPYQLKLGPIAMATLGFAMLCAAPTRAADTVKIAFIDVLSGPFARAGEGSLAQLREVVSTVNAKSAPGDPKFEVVPFDGKGSPQESVTVLRAATDQGIRYITQGGGSGVAFALSEALTKLAERDPDKATLFLNYSAMDPGLTNDRCSFWRPAGVQGLARLPGVQAAGHPDRGRRFHPHRAGA